MADNDRSDAKQNQLEGSRVERDTGQLTTQQGVRIDATDNSLRVGQRGPTLLEDFHAREKLTHFDHERIPERVVHARGAGAYGYFEPYDDSLAEFTAAKFLTEPDTQTPVFVRFSTVAGSRGSADTVRDVRGFATKFYTAQGNYDLVGNNFPIFFIQDGIKFPDFVHAVKPEPHNEIPQAASAHDTLWDFVSLQPETLHAIMWLMSDRALPRSYRMMQGFGVHTFRFVNAEGKGTFVKFHWKPKLGVHSLLWEECQRISGADPDFNRRDLWNAIESGHYPEWELGVQLVPEDKEFDFEFDLLDATKIISEDLVPVRPVGRMVLDRNPENFFAETEQVAFHTANLVPGIDFTNDPLLQARNFSYLDTQLIRLGGPNFSQIPVNRPIADVRTHQQDGYGQHAIPRGRVAYRENTLGGGCPALADEDVFKHYAQREEGEKIRRRSDTFKDHYSQANLFWQSMTEVEGGHIVDAFAFELDKVESPEIKEGVIARLNMVDGQLAIRVALQLGMAPPGSSAPAGLVDASTALSQLESDDLHVTDTIATRMIAVVAADGVDVRGIEKLREALTDRGATVEILAPTAGKLRGGQDGSIDADRRLRTTASVLYDAVIVPCGPEAMETLADEGYALHFIAEAYRHKKPIGAFGAGIKLLPKAGIKVDVADGSDVEVDLGVITTKAAEDTLPDEFIEKFANAVAHHRAWDRDTRSVVA